ncbi:uncharacterized protein LOC108136226 [Drosophila elegans]|uniref:uncharacterized protein LOC108136226 n=1 Tax=Drosophila elegans TaxID=30023 RepID=UPI0007E72D5C|nr:uncharacterized protein LOC108136226 [Drosophila elegans]
MDLNPMNEQIPAQQELLKDEDKQEDDHLRCKEAMRGEAIAKALGDVQIYVELGEEEAFVQMKPPQLHKFRVTPNGVDSGSSESNKFDRADPTDIARWDLKRELKLDLISSQWAEQIGKLQTDEVTGEVYMIVPIDINILVDQSKMTPDLATKSITEEDAYKEETGPGHTFYLYHDLDEHPGQLPKTALDQQNQVDSQDGQNSPDIKVSQDKEEQQPAYKANWNYHLHEFEVPKLSFPFELSLNPELVRLLGGRTENQTETKEIPLDSEEMPTDSGELPTDSVVSTEEDESENPNLEELNYLEELIEDMEV